MQVEYLVTQQIRHDHASVVSSCLLGLALMGTSAIIWPDAALAYRPFDGTDAAVAEPNAVEVEFRPVGRLREGSEKNLVALSTPEQNCISFPEQKHINDAGMELTDAGGFLKHVLRPGSLQDQSGPSVATEFCVLLPGINADRGIGASLAGIISQRWDLGTVHLNTAISLTRDHHADAFVGIIVEGPSKWPVRPVVEVFFEDELNQMDTVSGHYQLD